MKEERLNTVNSLASTRVHSDKQVPSDKIIDENESSATKSSFVILEKNDYNPAESRSNEPKEESDICRLRDLIWKIVLYCTANRCHNVNFELTLYTH